MVAILTEDIRTGYAFMRLMRDKIFVTEIEIYNTAYGDPNGEGGSSKFEQAINNLLKDNRLRDGDTLFLAFDNIIPIPAKPRMSCDLKAFQQKMARCERVLKNNRITYYKSNYVCIEELLLSFHEIIEFCSTPERNMSDPEVEKLKQLQGIISSRAGEIAYVDLFENLIASGSTVEKCLKALLQKITQDNSFRAFRLTDTRIGVCWQLDCEESQPNFNAVQKSNCKSCYAVHKLAVASPNLAKTRLGYLYTHSLFQSTFAPLELEVMTP